MSQLWHTNVAKYQPVYAVSSSSKLFAWQTSQLHDLHTQKDANDQAQTALMSTRLSETFSKNK